MNMIFSRAHNVVVYDHQDPGIIVGAIAGARKLSETRVAVPADLFSMQLARVLGLPIPDLLTLNGYDWPIQRDRKPFAHQKYMASFVVAHPKAFNLSDMGTGKTLATLWAADYLMQQGVVHKAVILSPLSVLSVWDDEIFRNLCGRRKATILHGEAQKRLDRLRLDVDFYLLNHDGLKVGSSWVARGSRGREMKLGQLISTIIARKDIDLVIVDEFTAYKEWATRRTKIMARLAAEKPYVWLLSGTPTPQAPTDAYAPARIVGNLESESLRSFKSRTMRQVSTFKWLPTIGSADIVRKALAPAVRFSRAECIDLPECVIETRDVEMSPTQEKAIKDIKKDLRALVGKGAITAINEAALRTKLIQIACGAVYGENHEAHRTDAAPRIKVLKEVIDEAGAKILVFVPFTSCVDMLYAVLKEGYGEKAVARIYGDTAQGTRAEIFRQFETASEPRIIVADPSTLSHGVTLVAANTIVWYGPTDRGEIFHQANARINRPGQKNRMLIIQLVSTAIEREIFRRLAAREALQGSILRLVEEER